MTKDDIKFVVDVETTGLDFRREKMVEVAAVKLVNNEIVDTYDSLINPMQYIRPSSVSIHGISEEMILEAPTIEEVMPQLLNFIGEYPMIGHNVIFDYSYINQASLTLYGKELPNRRIDTLHMFKEVFPEERSHSLESLMTRFDVKLENKHRALADAYGLAQVYGKLKSLYDERYSWQRSQLDNIQYLLERYLRIQSLIQTLQSEMGDIKSVFKIYFEEGGSSVEGTHGEVLQYSTRSNYQYDVEKLKSLIFKYNLPSAKAFKLNTNAIDRMIDYSNFDEEIKNELSKSRVSINETSTINIYKPDKSNVDKFE